jgi:hypothetical protein
MRTMPTTKRTVVRTAQTAPTVIRFAVFVGRSSSGCDGASMAE